MRNNAKHLPVEVVSKKGVDLMTNMNILCRATFFTVRNVRPSIKTGAASLHQKKGLCTTESAKAQEEEEDIKRYL